MATGTDFDDIFLGTNGNDTYFGLNGNDQMAGHDGDDYIDGGGGQDLLLGNAGNDYLDGGTGKDILFGGLGDDFLLGGAGADFLSGDDGADQLRGGSGADIFYFNGKTAGTGVDIILDYSRAQGDTIDFGKFAGGSLILTESSGNTTIEYDANSDGFAEYTVAIVLNATLGDVTAGVTFS